MLIQDWKSKGNRRVTFKQETLNNWPQNTVRKDSRDSAEFGFSSNVIDSFSILQGLAVVEAFVAAHAHYRGADKLQNQTQELLFFLFRGFVLCFLFACVCAFCTQCEGRVVM